jgi:hypothetical protein
MTTAIAGFVLTPACVVCVAQVSESDPGSAALVKPASAGHLESVFSWVRSKLGLGRQSGGQSPVATDGNVVHILGDVPTEVAEQITAVDTITWSRPSHEFRVTRPARNSVGSAELLRTSSEPIIASRRRRAREFSRNLDFYKDMAGTVW